MKEDRIIKLAGLLTHDGGYQIFAKIAMNKDVPYSDLRELVSNDVTLMRRLDELKSLSLIEREILNEKYRPTIYHITKKGEEIFWMLQDLEEKLK